MVRSLDMVRSWVVGVTCGSHDVWVGCESHDVWVGHGWQGSRVGHMIYG